MISVGVSKLGKTSVFFVEKGVKINSEYYMREIRTSNRMALRAIWEK